MNYLYESIHPTRLYIKKCSHCNLKYFGKTTAKNVESYEGSGVRWQIHLKKHKAKSIHLWDSDWYYDTSIMRFALKFSSINKIVESKNWANLIPENGINGGGNCSQMHLKNVRDKAASTCMEKYGVDHPFKSTEFRDKANQTIFIKYNTLPGQILTNKSSIEKRNNTNKKLYGSACAANKDGNKKSIETQKRLRNRNIVKTIKCILPFTKVKLGRAWWYKTDSDLMSIKQNIINQHQTKIIATKRDNLLSRKKVRIIIMINQITPLSLGVNWFQKTDNLIDNLYQKITEAHLKELDIALHSYCLLFSE
jgi:hypothetical protein